MGVFDHLPEIFPPAPKWTQADMPDLSGKVYLVTGGNTGLGKATVKALLEHNAKVYLAARSEEKAKVAIDELEKATGKRALFHQLDLSKLSAVKASAEEFLGKEQQLDALINNAGIMLPPPDLLSADGYGIEFGTNVIGHHLFTKLLLPVLFATTALHPEHKARVVNVSAGAHHMCKGIQYDAIREGPARKRMSPWERYGMSKYANIVCTHELVRRYGDKIIAITLHPGIIHTDLQRTVPKSLMWLGRIPLNMTTPDRGAICQLYAATAPEAEELSGKYLIPFARVGKAQPGTEDPEVGKKLWDYLEEQIKDV